MTMGRRIVERLDELAACTDQPGAITRLYLSDAHRRAAVLVTGWMTSAGMSPRLDAIGNVIGRHEGTDRGAPALLIASHIDSVPDAGKFDGNLGVVTAIEVVEQLRRNSEALPFAIEVVAFGDEEGTRFPSTLGGSRALAGAFDDKILDEADAAGITRRAALQVFGGDPAGIASLARDRTRYRGYLEIHIEQGPVLEAKDLPVGIVTAINGATRGTIEVKGVGGHAGTIPMTLRRDAYAAAAEMALAIEKRGRAEPDLVATVGRVEIPGAAVNSVPGLVRFTLDVRSPSDERRQRAVSDIRDAIAAIATARGVKVTVELGYQAPAAPCDAGFMRHLADAVEALGNTSLHLPSGAGHDAMSFRDRLPIAMLFVRCRGGVSHSPAEHASQADIDVAARTVLRFVQALAASPASS